jgi:ubiquinone/menaquinone biosynthesis C-methylase UbiE
MDLNLNAERFTGRNYISTYHQFRPEPPKEIILQALNYLDKSENVTVLDLGCGSGLSTKVWEDNAEKIMAFDPSKEMIDFASERNKSSKIEFKVGYSHDISLPSESVDIISCSQSFHWMEPLGTLKEVKRLLKSGGVFLVYDVIWPPCVNYAYELAYNKLFSTIDRLTEDLDEKIAIRWDKKKHYENIVKSNFFKFVKEAYFHKSETISKDKLLGIAMSQGGLEALLKRGFSKAKIGLDKFEKLIEDLEVSPDYIIYNYRVTYAIK